EVFRTVCWFHPFVWLVCNRLRLESEHACDDAVLSRGVSGADYAAQLLSVARELNAPDHVWSSALAMARLSTVERRFEAMLNPSVNRQPLRTGHLLAIAIAAAFLSIPVATFSFSAEHPKTERAQNAQPAFIQPVSVSRVVPETPTVAPVRPVSPAS